MSMLLEGKRALVTGSSRGIGSAIALELARAGADVVAHYAGNAVCAQEISGQIRAMGRQAQIIQADLSDPSACEGLIEKVGAVDILVLNASVQIKKNWMEITDEDFDLQINCNLRSSMKLIRQAVPGMQAKKWGRIVAIGSVQESKPHPDMLVYAASKAAQSRWSSRLPRSWQRMESPSTAWRPASSTPTETKKRSLTRCMQRK